MQTPWKQTTAVEEWGIVTNAGMFTPRWGVRTCARSKETRQDTSVRGCDERGTKCTGTTDEPHLIVKTWAT